MAQSPVVPGYPRSTVCHPGVSGRDSRRTRPDGSRQLSSTSSGAFAAARPSPKCRSKLRLPEWPLPPSTWACNTRPSGSRTRAEAPIAGRPRGRRRDAPGASRVGSAAVAVDRQQEVQPQERPAGRPPVAVERRGRPLVGDREVERAVAIHVGHRDPPADPRLRQVEVRRRCPRTGRPRRTREAVAGVARQVVARPEPRPVAGVAQELVVAHGQLLQFGPAVGRAPHEAERLDHLGRAVVVEVGDLGVPAPTAPREPQPFALVAIRARSPRASAPSRPCPGRRSGSPPGRTRRRCCSRRCRGCRRR